MLKMVEKCKTGETWNEAAKACQKTKQKITSATPRPAGLTKWAKYGVANGLISAVFFVLFFIVIASLNVINLSGEFASLAVLALLVLVGVVIYETIWWTFVGLIYESALKKLLEPLSQYWELVTLSVVANLIIYLFSGITSATIIGAFIGAMVGTWITISILKALNAEDWIPVSD